MNYGDLRAFGSQSLNHFFIHKLWKKYLRNSAISIRQPFRNSLNTSAYRTLYTSLLSHLQKYMLEEQIRRDVDTQMGAQRNKNVLVSASCIHCTLRNTRIQNEGKGFPPNLPSDFYPNLFFPSSYSQLNSLHLIQFTPDEFSSLSNRQVLVLGVQFLRLIVPGVSQWMYPSLKQNAMENENILKLWSLAKVSLEHPRTGACNVIGFLTVLWRDFTGVRYLFIVDKRSASWGESWKERLHSGKLKWRFQAT